MKLSIIIPAYNEQDNIADILEKIERVVDIEHELVIVNDHSTDSTAEIVIAFAKRHSNVKLVENKLNKGFANALRTGFYNVSTPIIIPIMADLCDDLSTIEIMFKKISQGYDVVCGSRYMKGGARLGGSKIKGAFSCFAGHSLHHLLNVPTHDIANAFKMYRKEVIDKIDIKSTGFEISMEIPLKAYYQGYKIFEVPTIWRERTKGKSSFKIFKLLPSYSKLYLWALIQRLKG